MEFKREKNGKGERIKSQINNKSAEVQTNSENQRHKRLVFNKKTIQWVRSKQKWVYRAVWTWFTAKTTLTTDWVKNHHPFTQCAG